jgi:hypothetical protein
MLGPFAGHFFQTRTASFSTWRMAIVFRSEGFAF